MVIGLAVLVLRRMANGCGLCEVGVDGREWRCISVWYG